MVHVVPQSRLARALMAPLRNVSTPPAAFKRHADRIARLVLAEALNTLPSKKKTVTGGRGPSIYLWSRAFFE